MSRADRLLISPAAHEDLGAILAYLRDRDPGAADRMCESLLEAITSLREFPRRGPIAEETAEWGREVRFIVVEPYRILYTVREQEVAVARVVHGHMRRPARPSS